MTPRKPTRAQALGIDDAEYARLLEAQGGHCALCPNVPKTRRLHVDHDHATGRVRGLLCYRCNRALPSYVGSQWLYNAALYVDGWQRTDPRAPLPWDAGRIPGLPLAIDAAVSRGKSLRR